MNELSSELLQLEKNNPFNGSFFSNKSLKNISWLKVGGSAEYLYIPYDRKDLSNFLSMLDGRIQINVFGRLSNVLIRDKGLSGVTILIPPSFSKFKIIEENMIVVEAGILDRELSQITLEEEISGMEFLSGIPGNIGGAVAMNAGCYGAEVKDILVEAKLMNRKGKIKVLSNKKMQFSYRDSIIKDEQIIVEATFKGKKKESIYIKEKIREVESNKKISQPGGIATAGSVFKNPKEKKAWELINSVNLSGYKIGGAMVSPKHNNFFVNTGSALAKDFEDLGNLAIERVNNKYGITLEWEIKVVGN
jgi:UDP-N-acetylmuramate dehydrogenase